MQLAAKHFFFSVFFVCLCSSLLSQNSYNSLQQPAFSKQSVFENNRADLFFVENIGQFKNTLPKSLQSKILFAFENSGNPVYLTKNGLIFLQRKFRVEEKRKRKKEYEEEEKYVLMELVECNTNPEFQKLLPSAHSYTYSESTVSAKGYKTIVYKNIYPGIDWVCSFSNNKKNGFEYRFIIHEGADASVIKMKYSGASELKQEADGSLKIISEFDNIFQSTPLCFETAKEDSPEKNLNFTPSLSTTKQTSFEVKGNTVSFKAGAYNRSKTLVIDPFITTSSGLTGLNGGIAKDIDFDFNGNIYVSGGGEYGQHQIAKYNSSGTLLWVFNGSVNSLPTAWVFGTEYGGWAVEKNTGKVYVGQGASFNPGIRVIRLSASGTYDNFVTTADALFTECWKLIWTCGNGNPQILIAGGTTRSNLNFGVITPPSTTVTPINITGIPNLTRQDIADAVVDPLTNDLYSVFTGRDVVNNRIFKHGFPYTSASIFWQVPTGYNNLIEANNRPYLHTLTLSTNDNSINAMAVNSSALFYWDGSVLAAYSKINGSQLANFTVNPSTPRLYSGIYVDECNNVFIGYSNGTIKVFKFINNSLDDAVADDISITGFPGSAVYDLTYDQQSKLLYASGNGFIAALNIASYCNAPDIYTLPVTVNCNPVTVQGTLQPAPPPNTVVTYSLFNGTTLISSNNNGFFNGLSAGINYTIRAVINQSCGGTVAISNNFDVNKCEPVSAVATNAECGNNSGTITVGTNYGTGPYQYSLNNGPFQTSNVFNNLAPGTYSVTVRDANNLPRTLSNIIVGNTSNFINITPVTKPAGCGESNGEIIITQTGGTGPYTYAINTPVNFQPSNIFSNLAPGVYNLFIRDANNCTATAQATISVFGGGPQITSTVATPNCDQNNGTITVNVSGGRPPYVYSINNGPFQASNVFTNLTAGTYTITVRDNINCTNQASETIFALPPPAIFLIPVSASCGGNNGRITAVVSGSSGPYSFSLNNGPFQLGNIFNNLASGTYNIRVLDANNCIVPGTVTVDGPSPILFSTSTVASGCAVSNGSITVNASGGDPPYEYSINNGPFQASNIFPFLLPGVYGIRVRDINSCITPPLLTTVTSTGAFTVSAVATPSTCGVNNGIITITASGGVLPYSYSINNGPFQASNLFTSLAPATYTIQVRDNNGCVTPASALVTATPTVAAVAISTAATCGANNGTVTVNTSGGSPPFTYSINNGPFQSGNLFTSLAPATYTVRVRENNGCITSVFSIVSGNASAIVNAVATAATCGSNNGMITINVNGGAAPYTYSINNGPFQPGNIFSLLAPGTYNIRVRENNGCIVPATATINSTSTAIVNAVATAATCGANNGIITISVSGGATPYTYSINNGPFQPGNIFSSLAPATYNIRVRENNGCIIPATATVTSTSTAIVNAVVTAATCAANNGIITINASGGTPPYAYSINNGPFQPVNVFSLLAPGTYNLQVRDNSGCITPATATVTSNSTAIVNTVAIPATCGANNGSINVNVSGGASPFSYSINNGPFQSNNIFSSLAPSTYNIRVRDNNGCIVPATATVASTATAIVSAVATPATCAANNGIITITASGGASPFTYSINNGPFQNSNVFTSLAPATYNLQVRDNNGCIVPANATVTATPTVNVNAVAIPATCAANNGIVTVNVSGGTSPFSFSINNGPFQSNNVFASLAPATYNIRVRENNGCITPAIVTITAIQPATVNTVATSATCAANNGIITITATGGSSPYTFSINNGPFQTGNIFASLAPNTYNIRVRDNSGCITPATATVTAAPTPSGTIVSTPSTCGLNNGTITVTASGGAPSYTYSINNGPFQISNVFSSLAAANYFIQVRDNSGCIIPLNGTVTAIAAPTVSSTNIPATCGLNNGSITVTASSGTPPYAYSINNGVFGTGNNFTSLAPGSYNIRVRDDNNCITPSTITIAAIPVFDIGLSSAPANCGLNNGTITVTVQGSTPPYVYSINNGPFQTSNVFSSLAPATYSIRVRDNFNCIVPGSIPVTVLSTLSVSTAVSNINCINNNNTVTITANGGAQPYTYSLNNSPLQSSNIFTQLSPGTYNIRVRDAVNCIALATVTVNAAPQLSISALISNTSCTVNNGQIEIAVQGGTAPFEYNINNGPFQNSGLFTGLAAGNYNYTIKDAKNCTRSGIETVALNNNISINTGGNKEICIDDSVKLAASVSNAASFVWLPATALSNPSVLQPNASPALTSKYYITAVNGACTKTDSLVVTVNQRPTANAGVDLITCFQQSIRLNGSGGSAYQWQPPVFLSNTGIQNPFILNPTRNVDYILTVTDDKGCTSKKGDTVKLFVEPANSIFAGNDTSISINQPLELNARSASNINFARYSWSPQTGLSNPFIANPVLNLSTPTNGITYRLTAVTISGCVVTDEIRVKVFSTATIFVPSGFTPNKDGLNDILAAIPVGIKTFKYFRIFNRWGELVFTTNDFKKGWNGIFKGIEQPPGTFTWQAEGIDFTGKTIQKSGLIHLIR
jgi:gliding motility-associated-like protein